MTKPVEDDDEIMFVDEIGGVPYKASDADNPEKPEKPIVINKIDPVTRRFKQVKTRRIRKHDFYSSSGKLIDDEND
jgi:hypothetical protein